MVQPHTITAQGQLLQSHLITDLYNKSFYKTKNSKEIFKKFNCPEIDYNNLHFLRPATQAPHEQKKGLHLVFSQEIHIFVFFLVALISEVIFIYINFPKHPKLS